MTRPARVVAVVINYNYGRFLVECLDAIDAQTHPDIDILVVDDCSTDDSVAIAQAWVSRHGRPLQLITKALNAGPAHSYNQALDIIRSSTYDAVGFLDADDYWKPNHIESLLEQLATSPAAVLAHSRHVDRTEAGTETPSAEPPGGTALEHLLSAGSYLALNSALVRADALARIDRLDEALRVCDLQLWLQLARLGDFDRTDEHTAVVRLHGASMRQTERLATDRLTLIARNVATRQERRWGRRRGRRLMRSLTAATSRPDPRLVLGYLVACRDAMSVPLAFGTQLAPVRRLARRRSERPVAS
jgi:glycosyltransferase involved in cell wall biosynthesis